MDSSKETNNGSLSGPRNERDSGASKRMMKSKQKPLDPRDNISNTPKGHTRGI